MNDNEAVSELTEQQAKEIAESLRKQQPDWWCPLARDACRPDCVCYIPSRARLPYTRAKYWVANEAYCDNAMFTETTIQY